jgi:polar amino acid transport system permease protein
MGLVDTFFNLRVLGQTWPLLLEGLRVTILLGVTSIVLGIAGGLLLALLRLYGAKAVRSGEAGYIDVFRAIPLLVLLVVIYYALPFVGIRLTSFAAATAALSLVSSAYAAEIFRAGIEAVPVTTREAAESLGYSRLATYRHVVFPLALRISLPALGNNLVNLVKTTTLAYAIAVPELLYASAQIWSEVLNVREMMNVLLVSYILYVAALVFVLDRVERALRIPGYSP